MIHMKPTMIFALAMLTFVTLMSAFGVHLGASVAPVSVPENMLGDVLYVCPATSSGWDTAAEMMRMMQTPITIGLFFALAMLLFAWGWGLYQNLLKDKFNKDNFLKPWGFTKLLFWVIVIVVIVSNTPNHYRIVHVKHQAMNFVLCESTTPNTWPDVLDGRWPKAAKYGAVTR